MLFTTPKYKQDFIKYENINSTKTRHFYLKCDVLENMNELIKVFNNNYETLNLNSSLLANIILEHFFKEFETLTDDEKLKTIKKEVIKRI